MLAGEIMNYKIVADSSANMLAIEGVEFVSVPLKIITEEKEYVDDANLDVVQMIEDLKTVKGKTGTSCPNIAEWTDAFAGADVVFAITITSKLSGSYAAAVQAKNDCEEANPNQKIYVIDSLSAGPELELIARKIKQYVEEGLSAEEVYNKIEEYKKSTHTLFCLKSLNNLAKNGRVSWLAAKVVGILPLSIIGRANEGTIQPVHKALGEKKAIETLYKYMKENGFDGGIIKIAHCQGLESANRLKETIVAEYPNCEVEIDECKGLCSFYAEKGGLMIGYEGK